MPCPDVVGKTIYNLFCFNFIRSERNTKKNIWDRTEKSKSLLDIGNPEFGKNYKSLEFGPDLKESSKF